MRVNLGHGLGFAFSVALGALEGGVDKDPVCGQGAVAIAVAIVACVQLHQLAFRADRTALYQKIFGLAAMRARIHAQRSADCARYSGKERKPADPRLGGFLGYAAVQRKGARRDLAAVAVNRDPAKAGGQAHHDTRHAAVAHQHV